MKTAVSAIVLAVASLGAASAAELDYPPEAAFTSTQTRAQVQADLQQARAAGQVTFAELDYPAPAQPAAHTATRAEVREELQHARAAGQIPFGELDYAGPQEG